MSATGEPARLLRDVDWGRVADTDADTVELKVVVGPGADVVDAVADQVRRTRSRRLYLVDTAGARLARAGLVLRVRRWGRRRADVVVRARGHAHRGTRRPGARVELDVLPGTLLRTEQVGRALDPTVAAAFVAGSLPASALLSDEQHHFLRQAAAAGPGAVRLDALLPHGPLVVERMRLRSEPWGGARAFVERCTYPDGSRLDELSVRCEPSDAVRAAARADRFLERRGLGPAERPHSKTDTWLERIAEEPVRPAR